MARRDAYEDKHILYSQSARKARCLGMLKGKGVAIPQQAIDVFTEKATILQREAADLEYIDERILAGIDLYGSNLGLIDHSVASSLQIPGDRTKIGKDHFSWGTSPGCSVGDLLGEIARPNPDLHATVPGGQTDFTTAPDDPIS
ncbi:unnamed protein product [Brassica rapa]|uniref:Uncharacterized protein n=1 Tax=Brassica campestris TaxID=3711 RepID=A0A8D9HMX5_BRACM|nr:unnamed protein product [Brassica rapa]